MLLRILVYEIYDAVNRITLFFSELLRIILFTTIMR